MSCSRMFQNAWMYSLALIGVLVICAPAAAAPKIGKTVDEIVKLAKKEPPVRIASNWRGKILKSHRKGFKRKYGLTFKFQRVGGLASRERIFNEAFAGVVEYDFVNVSSELHGKFIKAGVIVPVEWASLFPSIKKENISPTKYFLGTGFNQFGITYNTNLVSADQAPKTWDDCLDPKWKGKIGISTRPLAFIPLHMYWGKKKSIAYHKRLKNNNPVWKSGTTSSVVGNSAGEYSILCGIQYHALKNVLRRDPKAPIKFVYPPEYPFTAAEALALMKGAKAPNSAILLGSYLATEGQPAYSFFGRSSPFLKGSEAYEAVKKTGVKVIYLGWSSTESNPQREASRAIVSTWGFPKGRK